ncbi:bifunctional diguanylate cyclase/phosphodiesterase [Clostridium sp. C8-1-8]|uniref:putative bifunctional diguanylate cyclase/phosphodiesterase n=1 Tax=Clostridium sp. C8-1-8 TaxID=2698831 RepID=UPI001367DB56|nr:bifunctional diguanylate cyclase/phosphodiesterase [Clostridium sp. C8-1-8]
MNISKEKEIFRLNFYNLSYSFKEINMILEDYIRNYRNVRVAIINIDDFKSINMVYGYDFGDLLLNRVMSIIKNTSSSYDMIFRFCGDRFIYISCENSSEDEFSFVLTRLINKLREILVIDGKQIYITVSIGAVPNADKLIDNNQILRYCESALEEAKLKGGNCYCVFNKTQYDEMLLRKSLYIDLRKAFHMNKFRLYFQPQVNVINDSIDSAEVLVRWEHETNGLLMPNQFINALENSNLSNEFDYWILKEACKQNKLWQESGYKPIALSVNISHRQFYDENFIPNLTSILDDTQLEPKYLQIEITERIFMEPHEKAVDIVNKMRELGILVVLDDFGIGYSSVLSFIEIPFDIVKLDKSFVNSIGYSEEKRKSIDKFFKFIHQFNKKVIIEGVENNEQLEFIRNAGFYHVQGFLFSPPVDKVIFESMFNLYK